MKKAQPSWLAPMLATLTYQPFSDPNWIYERKLDGMRVLIHKNNGKIQIWSRNKKDQNKIFPELVAALKKYASDFIIDCEVVAFAGTKTSFEKLQERMHVIDPEPKLLKKVPVTAFVFDILFLNGHDLRKVPLIARKQILKDNFNFSKPFKYLIHRKENGLTYLQYAAKHGWEGIIAKEADSIYLHKRAPTWLKFKCDFSQEFVIGGYTKPQGSRLKFGALLLGYYHNKKFKYAGKVGTGFDVETLIFLHNKMQPLITNKTPFTNYDLKSKSITWLKPKLVVQLGYTEWTSDGRLRHPRYLGLRNDKKAIDVVREQPKK